jgi:hypothetical protein
MKAIPLKTSIMISKKTPISQLNIFKMLFKFSFKSFKKQLLFLSTIVIFSANSFGQTVLFSEDFNGSLPAEWTNTVIDGPTGYPGWEWTDVGGDWGGQLNSTTAANGYMILNSDANGVSINDPEDAELISPAIDCSNVDLVELSLEHWARSWEDMNISIIISTDDFSTETVIYNWSSTVDQTNGSNPVESNFDISAYAAGASELKIKFKFQGDWEYWWLIDDIEVIGKNLIWQEDFTYADNTNTGTGTPGITSWTADGGERGVTVMSNQLRGLNTRNPNPDQTIWTIDSDDLIEIGGFTDVMVTMDLDNDGNLDNPDYIQIQYNLDETGWVDFPTNGYLNGNFATTTASVTGLNGNTLQLQVIMYCNVDNEIYYVDNIQVTGTPTYSGSGNIYYSYQTGNWDVATTWTHDPGGTTQTAVDIPHSGDIVVILNGRTVTLDDDLDTAAIDLTIREGGVLNQSTFEFTAGMAALRGSGTHKLASINYPAIPLNAFATTDGGTTEYNNASDFTLPLAQTEYYNLRINASGTTASQLSDITLNGDLHIKQGTFQINDNTANRRQLTISGDVLVDNGASITIGTGDTDGSDVSGGTAPFTDYYDKNSHRIVVYGDFTNNGTVKFTNQNYPEFDAFPTNGMATVYFMGASNNTLTCNGTTDFYNLVLDKGIDQTFKLTVYSTAYENFRLFGRNDLDGENNVDNPDLRKALWIRTGTLELTGITIIPSLTEAATSGGAPNGDFYLPVNGALKLNGSQVVVYNTADDYQEVNLAYNVAASSNADLGILTSGGNQSLSIYGKLQIENGYFSTKESGGIITWDKSSGELIINGGIIDAKQYRSSGTEGGLASFSQSGGTFILRGRFQRTPATYASITNLKDFSTTTLNTTRETGGLDGNFGTFNINEAENVFAMSGGTIRIYDVCGTGQNEAFQILSDAANNNVTGGTIEIAPTTGSGTDATVFHIETTADIGNLTINRASSTATVDILNNNLTILNDFTITSGDFDANDLNVAIGGDFKMESGTTYTPGTNTTSFNGSQNQLLTVNTASAPSFNNLTLNNSSGNSLTLNGTQTEINIEGTLTILKGELADNEKTINASGTIYNSATHSGDGKIVLNGTTAQTINGDGNGIFGNIELNNTSAETAPVTLGANATINGELTFSQDKLFDISTYKLRFGEDASVTNAGANRFIQTAGNAGDGGVEKTYAATATSFTFPVGSISTNHVAAEYTPAEISFGTNPTTFGSINVIPVGYEHPNTTTNGRSLTYFWRVKSSDFDMGPATVSHSYTYSENDVVTGADITEAGYLAASYSNTTYTWTKYNTTDITKQPI